MWYHNKCFVKTVIRKVQYMYVECNWFSAEKIHLSGQCFRWEQTGDNTFIVPAFEKRLTLTEKEENIISLDCTEDEYRSLWKSYFDLDFDYKTHAENACKVIDSSYLTAATQASKGVRILKQELWETTVSFIISANNNIPRIRKILSGLCEKAGGFPTPQKLGSMGIEAIRSCGTGYRDKYLLGAADFFLTHDVERELSGLGYSEAKKYLKQILGVGPKVADCICLFSLSLKDAFPRDVWIKRIEEAHFGGRFPEEKALGGAGVLQQYLFFYERSLN